MKKEQEKLAALYEPEVSSCKKIHCHSSQGLNLFHFGMLTYSDIIILLPNYFTTFICHENYECHNNQWDNIIQDTCVIAKTEQSLNYCFEGHDTKNTHFYTKKNHCVVKCQINR